MKKNMFKMALAVVVAMAGAAIAAPVMAADAPTLKVCSGAKGGVYDFAAETLKAQLASTVKVENINTAGSWENLQKVDTGACDVAFTQSDGIYLYSLENPNAFNLIVLDANLYTEYFHLICNRKSGVEEFGDLTKATPVFTGGRGTGADITLRGLIRSDIDNGGGEYKEVPLLNEGGAAALIKLNGGAAACMAYTGAPGSKFVSSDATKFADNLVIVPVVDRDFNDATYTDSNGKKQSVWTDVVMPYNAYTKLMPSGFTGRKDVDTMGVSATVVISSEWATANPDAFGEVGLAIPDVKNIVRSAKKLQ